MPPDRRHAENGADVMLRPWKIASSNPLRSAKIGFYHPNYTRGPDVFQLWATLDSSLKLRAMWGNELRNQQLHPELGKILRSKLLPR